MNASRMPVTKSYSVFRPQADDKPKIINDHLYYPSSKRMPFQMRITLSGKQTEIVNYKLRYEFFCNYNL